MQFPATDPLGALWQTATATALTELLTQVALDYGSDPDLLAPSSDVARRYLLGGKRLRPAFAYWSYVAAVGQSAPGDQLLQAALSLEFLHAGLLVHDDLIDAAATRRGVPSAHLALAVTHESARDPIRFGDAAAVLLGARLMNWANCVLEESQFPPAVLARARRVLAGTCDQVLTGQYLDLAAEQIPGLAPERATKLRRSVLELKTASYTIVGPVLLGAALAEAAPKLVAALTEFAQAVGVGFQLRDDLLDLFGDPDHTGKQIGGDIICGKRTELFEAAYAVASPSQRIVLDTNLGNPVADIDAVRAVITDTDASSEIEHRIRALESQASIALSSATMTSEGQSALTLLARSALFRDR